MIGGGFSNSLSNDKNVLFTNLFHIRKKTQKTSRFNTSSQSFFILVSPFINSSSLINPNVFVCFPFVPLHRHPVSYVHFLISLRSIYTYHAVSHMWKLHKNHSSIALHWKKEERNICRAFLLFCCPTLSPVFYKRWCKTILKNQLRKTSVFIIIIFGIKKSGLGDGSPIRFRNNTHFFRIYIFNRSYYYNIL